MSTDLIQTDLVQANEMKLKVAVIEMLQNDHSEVTMQGVLELMNHGRIY